MYNLYKVHNYTILDGKYTLNLSVTYNCMMYNLYNYSLNLMSEPTLVYTLYS